MPPDVVFALTGDVRRNARALRQLRVLVAMGLRVHVCTLGDADPDFPEVTWAPLPKPAGRGPRFFGRAHRQLAAHLRALPPARLYHASDLYTLPALAGAARRHGARLVFDARELYPDTPAVAHRPLVRAAWRAMERRFVPRADLVLTVGEGLAAELARRYPLRRAPVVLHNAPRPHTGPPADLRAHAGLAPGTPVVLHTGALREGRGLPDLVRAMAGVPATLVLLGEGPLAPALLALADATGAAVHLASPVPPAEVPAFAAAADVGAVPLEDTCLNLRLALPNKLFEYIAGGLPIVATDLPELARVVRGGGLGLTVPPGDVPALRAALHRLLTDSALRAACQAAIPASQAAFSTTFADTRFAEAYRWLLSADLPSSARP